MSEFVNRILVVDDEERIRRLLRLYLEKEGYSIEEAEDGGTALQKAIQYDYDLIILDLMLPGIDGIEVCARLRQKKATPVLILTAKGDEVNRVQGFEAGADDYVVKPFSPREVVSRIKAILRRSSATAFVSKDFFFGNNKIVFPHLIIEHDARRVTARGQEVNFTPKEYDLLHFLASSPDKVFSREELLRDVWKYDFFGDIRTVDTHIKRVREKLNRISPEAAAMITTVWGIGYKLEVQKDLFI